MQPVYLFAATAVLIPIILHLWNVQQGKILKVGSVALLTKDAVKTTSSIKLHDLLLLLLRCLLIILLALLLSQPRWRADNTAGKGWVLMDKNDVQNTYNHFKPQVDSLLAAGFEFHYFNTGFEKKDLSAALSEKPDSAGIAEYWATMARLSNGTNTSIPLYIFTSNYLAHFNGNRAGATANVHWFTYIPADTSTYTAGAYETSTDSLHITTAASTAAGTYNAYNDIAKTAEQNITIPIDTTTLHVAIYAKDNATDARYIKAAIDAVQQFSKRKIVTSVLNNVSGLPANIDGLFWLSSQPIPAGVQAKNIFMYQTGQVENIQSAILAGTNQSATGAQAALYKHIAATTDINASMQTIWADGYGNPLLAKQSGTANIYSFYSHFDASWNDLVWNNQFPQMIYSLLYPGNSTGTINQKDKRVLDSRQLQPYKLKENSGALSQLNNSTDISPAFWLAACIIFLIERLVSLKAKKERVYA